MTTETTAQAQITLSGYLQSWLKGMVSAYKPKNLPFTLGLSLGSSAVGTVLTLFVFKGVFSHDPTVNAAYSGLGVTLTVFTVMNLLMGLSRGKKDYLQEMSSTARLWLAAFQKGLGRKERAWALALTLCGLALGCWFSHPFMVLLGVALWFFAVAGEQGQLLLLVAAAENSFNGRFRPGHRRDPQAARRNLAGLALGMFAAAAVCWMGGLLV